MMIDSLQPDILVIRVLIVVLIYILIMPIFSLLLKFLMGDILYVLDIKETLSGNINKFLSGIGSFESIKWGQLTFSDLFLNLFYLILLLCILTLYK